jgi:GTPase SAR1 family protein
LLFNYIIGPAGSGKTTLVNTFYEHVINKYNELKVITINLDPGVRNLPYNAHIDVRDFITLEEVMANHNLGPNGGLIAATDMIIDFVEDIKFEITEYNNPDLVIIDTPGQLELFAFRATGPLVASSLGFGDVQKIVSFLFDPAICRHPNGFISTLFLSSSVQFRFQNIAQLNILSKIDMIEGQIVDRIIEWSEDYQKLEDATSISEKGLVRETSIMLARMFEQLGGFSNLLGISSVNFEGIDDYWGAIQRTVSFDESPYY